MTQYTSLTLIIAGVIGTIGLAMAMPPLSSQLEEGRLLYERHCMGCHGPEGRGDGKQALSLSPRPGNFISAQTSAKTDQDLLKIIANGKPRTAMTGWKDRLSNDEQQATLVYIRSLIRFTRSATPPPPAP